MRDTEPIYRRSFKANVYDYDVRRNYVKPISDSKGKQMIPTEDGVAAIRNIPDYLKSASMTAEWENDLLRMERGEIKPMILCRHPRIAR